MFKVATSLSLFIHAAVMSLLLFSWKLNIHVLVLLVRACQLFVLVVVLVMQGCVSVGFWLVSIWYFLNLVAGIGGVTRVGSGIVVPACWLTHRLKGRIHFESIVLYAVAK